jgi:hypothetical protein
MFHMNALALGMFVLAGIVGVSASHIFFAGNANVGGGISGAVMLMTDAWYRHRQKPLAPPHNVGTLALSGKWWSAHCGGFIAIMPSWLMGITLMLMALTRPYWHLARGL